MRRAPPAAAVDAAPCDPCPLCGTPEAESFRTSWQRRYFHCATCGLVFMAPGDRLDAPRERARYETHENDPADARYRAFLSRLLVPLVEKLSPGAEGLDYGSGPGPTLSVMLEERGFPMALYDPFFAPGDAVLQRSYDFVTCSETAEHFYAPGLELDRIDRLLRPGGWLALMTQLLEDDRTFDRWHYAREPSHVSFYRPRTLRWVAEHWRWDLELFPQGVGLFHKSPGKSGPGARSAPQTFANPE